MKKLLYLFGSLIVLSLLAWATTTVTPNLFTTPEINVTGNLTVNGTLQDYDGNNYVKDDGSVFQSKINEVYYVIPNNASDIQKKINSASNGDVVEIPIGIYLTSSQIDLNKSITLRGQGEGTEIRPTGDFSAIEISEKAKVENLKINGSLTSTQKDGIRLISGSAFSEVSKVYIYMIGRAGVFATSTNNIEVNNIKVDFAGYNQNEGRGIWYAGVNYSLMSEIDVYNSSRYGCQLSSGSSHNTIENCYTNITSRTNETSGRGIYINTNSNYNTIVGGHVLNSALTGINIGDSKYTSIIGTEISNTENGISSEARCIESDGGNHVSISNVIVSNCEDFGIWINSDNVTISNAIIKNTVVGIFQQTAKDNLNIINPSFDNVTQQFDINGNNIGSIISKKNVSFFANKPESDFQIGRSGIDLDIFNYIGANGLYKIGRTSGQYFGFTADASSNDFLAYGKDFQIGTGDSNRMQLQTNGSDRMTITASGNVLIGTTAENGYKLEINGAGGILADNYYSSDGTIGASGSGTCTINEVKNGLVTNVTCS